MTEKKPHAPDIIIAHAMLRRLRAHRALTAAVTASLYAFTGLVGAMLLVKLGAIPDRTGRWILPAIALCPLAVGALAALRRARLLDAAALLDDHYQLHDRISISLQFRDLSPEQRTPWTEAAIDDAVARAREGLRPAEALPWRWPWESRGAIAMLALFAGLSLIEFPLAHTLPALVIPPTVRRDPLVLDEDDLAAFREMSRAIERDARSPESRRTVGEFQRFLDDVAAQRLDREDAFRRLAALQRSIEASARDERSLNDQAMRSVSEAMERSEATRALSDALRRGDPARAAQELRALAEQARQQQMDQARREQLARALTPREPPQDESLRRQVEQARREIEEMIRRQRERAPSRAEQELLRRRQQSQAQREQELQRRDESRRRAEHLQRELSQAARDMLRDLQQAAQGMDRAAEDLSRMRDEQQGQMSMQELRQRLEEMREQMRQQNGQNGQQQRLRLARFARSANGRPQQGQGQQGQQGQGRQGQQGQQGQGQQGQGQQGQGTSQGGLALMPGGGGIPIPVPTGATPQERTDGQGGNEQRGSGAGAQHDDNLRGSATDLSGRTRALAVAGQQSGQGPSRSQVIRSAASDGFANRPYRQVYSPYWDRAREVLHQGEVPPGYRSYVRRYFQLIRPREETSN